MTTKFIHSEFEINLSNFNLQWSEENPWFSDSFYLPFSFPIEVDLDDLPFLEPLRSYNSDVDTYYKGILLKNGEISKAEMKVEEIAGTKLNISFKSGLDNFPNWDKKLRELDFDKVSGAMIDAAELVINKTYPDTNYNFPMVHTDMYVDVSSMTDFHGILNRRINNEFTHNGENVGQNIYRNYNIVYPFPYVLYVLKRAIAEAGHDLAGDILEDEQLKNVLILPSGKLSVEERIENMEWIVGVESFDDLEIYSYIHYGIYESVQPINLKGKFRIQGTVTNDDNRFNLPEAGTYIRFNNELVWSDLSEGVKNVDFEVLTDIEAENELSIKIYGMQEFEVPKADLKIIPVEIWDENGNDIPRTSTYYDVNLGERLPDITVGEFITFLKNLKNYDFNKSEESEVSLNLIGKQLNRELALDFRRFENVKPKRKFNDAQSFLFQFQDTDKHEYKKVFFDKNGVKTDGYKVTDTTKTITVNAWPLPIETINDITTAKQISNDETKIQLVRYSGLKNNQNICGQTNDLLAPALVNQFWKSWFYFRINTRTFTDMVTDHKAELIALNKKSILFWYNNYFVVKTLDRTSLDYKTEQVEIVMDKLI